MRITKTIQIYYDEFDGIYIPNMFMLCDIKTKINLKKSKITYLKKNHIDAYPPHVVQSNDASDPQMWEFYLKNEKQKLLLLLMSVI